MVRTRSLSGAVLLLASLAAGFVAFRVPAQYPMPGYFTDIQEWTRSARIADTFTPLAYPLFAGPAFRVAGVTGVIWLQVLLHLLVVATSIGILRRVGVAQPWCALGALPVALYPEYLLSIPKLWDVGLSTSLLFLLILLLLGAHSRAPGFRSAAAVGAVLGAGTFCRPNYALMLPVVLYAFLTCPGVGRGRVWKTLGSTVVVGCVVFAGLGVLSHGSVFLPRNGPYNLFAGNNPGAQRALLDKLNAEPSLPEAFRALYPPPLPDTSVPDFYYQPALEPFYSHAAGQFAFRHPIQEVKLVAVKLLTLFRPDTKVHGMWSLDGIGKLILALPAPTLLLLLFATRGLGLDRMDRLLLLAYGAYILPFLVTNSDPRFRLPLDGLLLLHLARRLYLIKIERRTRVVEDAVALSAPGVLESPSR